MLARVASLILVASVIGCTECDSCKKETTAPTSKSEATSQGAAMVVLDVENMVCEAGCAKRVEEILASYPGVHSVKVDFASKTALVDPKAGEGLDTEAMTKALADAGYPAKVK